MKMNKKYITVIALSAALITPFACSKNFLTQTNTFQSTDGSHVSEIIRCGIPD